MLCKIWGKAWRCYKIVLIASLLPPTSAWCQLLFYYAYYTRQPSPSLHLHTTALLGIMSHGDGCHSQPLYYLLHLLQYEGRNPLQIWAISVRHVFWRHDNRGVIVSVGIGSKVWSGVKYSLTAAVSFDIQQNLLKCRCCWTPHSVQRGLLGFAWRHPLFLSMFALLRMNFSLGMMTVLTRLLTLVTRCFWLLLSLP